MLAKLLAMASIVVYCASLSMPSFEVLTKEPDVSSGWLLLVLGVFSVPMVTESVFVGLPWFANLSMLRTYLALWDGHPGDACASAGVSLVLGASFMLVKETRMQGMCELHPIRLHAGYFLWLASMVLALASGATTLSRNKQQTALLMAGYRKQLFVVAILCVVYVALGLSLPIGDCSLLR